MKIRYKKKALDDILETQRYISEALHNKKAAAQLTERVFREISQLSEYPFMGVPLNSKHDVDTDIRVLTVAKQLVFYRVISLWEIREKEFERLIRSKKILYRRK